MTLTDPQEHICASQHLSGLLQAILPPASTDSRLLSFRAFESGPCKALPVRPPWLFSGRRSL